MKINNNINRISKLETDFKNMKRIFGNLLKIITVKGLEYDDIEEAEAGTIEIDKKYVGSLPLVNQEPNPKLLNSKGKEHVYYIC